jgi:hypothetical protein
MIGTGIGPPHIPICTYTCPLLRPPPVFSVCIQCMYVWLYVCMYVYMYVCMYVCSDCIDPPHTPICTYTCPLLRPSPCIQCTYPVYVCMVVCMYVCIYVCMHVCMYYMYAVTGVSTYVRRYVCMYACMHVCT